MTNEAGCVGELNHSALAVGYNLNATIPYIEVLNGWGTEFGGSGYYRIALGDLNLSNKGYCKLFDHHHNLLVELI